MSDEMISLGAKLTRLAREQPDLTAVSCGADSLTYDALNRRACRMAHGLAAQGVRAGDFVTLAVPNSVDAVAAIYGIWKLGATPQPASFRLPQSELREIIALADSRLVIAEFDYDAGRPMLRLDDLLTKSLEDGELPDVTPEICKAVTSGGSTGRPKLILSGGRGEMPVVSPSGRFGLDGETVALMPGPLYHNGPFIVMMETTSRGGHLVLTERFDAETTLREIARRRVTWAYLVPTMMNRIWRLPQATRDSADLSSLRTLWHMAAPCPAWLKEAFIDWLAPAVVMELYGGTEGIASTTISGAEWRAHRGSVGRVVSGEMKIIEEGGKAASPGQVGEIYMRRAPGTPPTYSYVGAVARSDADGWESLGDLGWFDEEGYLYIADRRTDMILVGGANVYPAEIEAALEEHAGVRSCAVIGLPDDDLGARLHAVVNAEEGVTSEALSAHLATRLVTYKRPRTFEFTQVPVRDDAGKVRRSALRDARLAPDGLAGNPTPN